MIEGNAAVAPAAPDEPPRAPGLGLRDWRRDLLDIGPLQRRLFVIVAVGLLPLALLSFATLFHNARVQRADVIRATDDTARAILTAVDTEVAVATATLRALALSPRLARRDWPAFHAEAASLLERMPGWVNIVLSTPTAGQIVNARLPYGAELPTRVAPNSVAAVAGDGKPGVGNLVVG
ncbi:MAG TPA: hypothetical protein VFX05_09930, partial [Casimicrobiaceae bacterium]|nr:hypothetical protein [Casimicrobiaceae bacterium]